MTIKSVAKWLYDFCVPQFITEDVAVIDDGEGYVIECAMCDVEPEEVFDGVATIEAFTWLGVGFMTRQVGDVRPWSKEDAQP